MRAILENTVLPVFFQPLFLFPVVGHCVLHQRPKAVGVVHLDQVGQLVYDDVIYHVVGCEQQASGKVDVALRGTTAPVRPVVFQVDGIDGLLEVQMVQFGDAADDLRLKILGDQTAQKVLGGLFLLLPVRAFCNAEVYQVAVVDLARMCFIAGGFDPQHVLSLPDFQQVAIFIGAAINIFAAGAGQYLLFHPFGKTFPFFLLEAGWQVGGHAEDGRFFPDGKTDATSVLKVHLHRNRLAVHLYGCFLQRRFWHSAVN